MVRPLNAPQKRVLRSGITNSPKAFRWAIQNTSRVNIVAEGDSWFAYPRKHLMWGKRSNMLDWVAKAIYQSGQANLLRLASNGDEAVAMMSGKQNPAEIFKTSQDGIQLILFSGGGNDVVGKWDMERLLKPYRPGYQAADCIHKQRFRRKLLQIRLAFEELIELRDDYAPSAQIVTHTYDFLTPGNQAAKFIAGLVSVGPRIYPYLMEKNIPESLHAPIVRFLLTELRVTLEQLKKGSLHVVNTQGILRPGHRSDWKDEMHPTASGFRRLSKVYYQKLRELEPQLPAFRP